MAVALEPESARRPRPARDRPDAVSGRRFLAGGVVGLLLFAAMSLVAVFDHGSRTERERVDAASVGHETSLRLQSALDARLSLTGGIAAYSYANQDTIDQESFESFARELASKFDHSQSDVGTDPAIRSLQIALDGVVTYVWPIEGNEAAIGHDILNDPDRGPAARRAVEARDFVLAGPFELLQGGTGLVGRAPVFDNDDGEFWGFSTIVVNFDELLLSAGIDDDVVNGHRIGIRGRDGLGADGETFLGEETLFDDDAVTLRINLPQGAWQLAVRPAEGWVSFWERPSNWAILGAGAALAALVLALNRRWLRAQHDAQRASNHVAVLVDAIDGPIISTDRGLQVTHWNRGAEVLSGVPHSDAMGAHLVDLLGELRVRRTGELLTNVAMASLTESRSRAVEVCVAGPDGERVFDLEVTVLRDGGLVLAGMDATARRQHERLEADIAALERISTLKDQFVATTSHEMRTPLTSIIGLSEMLGDGSLGELNASQSKAVQTVERAGAHMLSVVNQVLDLADITANGLELSLERVAVADIVRPVVDMIEPLATSEEIELTVRIADVGVVDADRVRLGQVVLNLASNAVKFTDRGGAISIDVDQVGDSVRIAVTDTGIGIPPDKQHLLFQPFVRIESDVFSSGTGLGLSIAAETVRLHGGTITVDSDPGRATTFTVLLPLTIDTVRDAAPLRGSVDREPVQLV